MEKRAVLRETECFVQHRPLYFQELLL